MTRISLDNLYEILEEKFVCPIEGTRRTIFSGFTYRNANDGRIVRPPLTPKPGPLGDKWHFYDRRGGLEHIRLDDFVIRYLEKRVIGVRGCMDNGKTTSITLSRGENLQITDEFNEILNDVAIELEKLRQSKRQESNYSQATDSELESGTPTLNTAEREAVVKVRYGQGSFRDDLFVEGGHGEKCWMSGIEGRQLLIASHIRPWSRCKDEPASRLKADNGLLLSALWDAAFDVGLISFDCDWKVIASSRLSESARKALNLDVHSALPEKFRTDGRGHYLAYHREYVFEHWNRESA